MSCIGTDTWQHGVSLTTFYNRVDKYEPTIIIIRSSTQEVSSHNVSLTASDVLTVLRPLFPPLSTCVDISPVKVFGAYCSQSWAQRNQKDDKGEWGSSVGSSEE